MNNLPGWIPKPSSWLSAVLLILLVRGIAVAIGRIFEMGYSLMDLSPKMQILLYFALLLSPIPVVAIAHHWLNVFLDRYSPNTRSPELGKIEGILPGLMSWWEGLYGWMTIALAMLLSGMIRFMFFFSYDSLYEMLGWWDELRNFFTIYTLIRVVAAAYLYEFEHTVRHHLMAAGAANQSERE
ncbi:hypothetical protein [Argonema galeatum]|uniref:hypothetical protein n=1 Tax=Argonema galeatum TaxID=2942762 RepID=UPI002011CF8D|nr:hypothetical protein [Argonema galeatum]MCL1467789.1 hypothetical protein [Argonema galeatum A003/A1]